jgi:hypothetical protein
MKTIGFIFVSLIFVSGHLYASSTGSGVIVGSDGYILTNFHVVQGASEVIVDGSFGEKVTARIIASNPEKDIAILKISKTDLKPILIGRSADLKILQDVYAIGFPLASALGSQPSASQGKFNAWRQVERQPLLQIDANINPGSSGGPILNNRGGLVGIAVSKLNAVKMLNEQGTIPERINFAVPIDECLSILAATGIKLIFSPDSLPLLPADEVFENAKQSVVFVTSITKDQEQNEASISGPVANPQVLAAVTAWEQQMLKSDPSYIVYQKKVYSRIAEIVALEGQPTDPVYAVHIANQALGEVKTGLGFEEGRALNLVAQQFRFFPNLDPGELATSFSDPSEMNGKKMARATIADGFSAVCKEMAYPQGYYNRSKCILYRPRQNQCSRFNRFRSS